MTDRSKSALTISNWVWCLLWASLVLAALFMRPILPIDETRYLSVAWDMWLREDYLVPHLNGVAYSHKPPLLFWLINIGWAVFGINEIWPRLIAPLFGLGCLALTSLLGRRLYPDTLVHFLAPLLLVGCYYWGVYTTLTMFDLILTFWTLVGFYGLVLVWHGSMFLGWLFFGFAIGLGILTKGPINLVFLLPSAILGPYWSKSNGIISKLRWYRGLLPSMLLGAIIALLWAIPAGEAGGATYKEAILWGQSAGRIVESFAHKKPIWWYICILPGLVLPWIIWPSFIRGLWQLIFTKGSIKTWGADPKIRYLIIWILFPLLVISIISGKQPHYLLPIFPALALGASVVILKLDQRAIIGRRLDLIPIAVVIIVFGGIILFSPTITAMLGKPEYGKDVIILWSIPLFVSSLFLLIRPPISIINRCLTISIISVILVITIHGISKPRLDKAYDLRKISNILLNAQKQGYIIANMDKYHGQYNFLGRLIRPIVVTDSKLLEGWLKKNLKSKIVSYHYSSPEKNRPEYFQAFRGRYIAIWNGTRLVKNPKMAFREN